jgi:hypothetical protein
MVGANVILGGLRTMKVITLQDLVDVQCEMKVSIEDERITEWDT